MYLAKCGLTEARKVLTKIECECDCYHTAADTELKLIKQK